MIAISSWMNNFLQVLTECFGQRVWFVGLQGSYGRGEATEGSDIDAVVILDRLEPEDIRAYHDLLDRLPHRELICGFFSGKEELLNWEPSDLFQFYHDTTPILGSLDELLTLMDSEAVNRAIKIGACNLYHGCVHNILHERSKEILRGLYKAAAFTAQAVYFRETGTYIPSHTRLAELAAPQERRILETALALKRGGKVDFEEMSGALFAWVQKRITETE